MTRRRVSGRRRSSSSQVSFIDVFHLGSSHALQSARRCERLYVPPELAV